MLRVSSSVFSTTSRLILSSEFASSAVVLASIPTVTNETSFDFSSWFTDSDLPSTKSFIICSKSSLLSSVASSLVSFSTTGEVAGIFEDEVVSSSISPDLLFLKL